MCFDKWSKPGIKQRSRVSMEAKSPKVTHPGKSQVTKVISNVSLANSASHKS